MKRSILFLALCLCSLSAVSAPQVFKSKAVPGTMDDYYRVTVTRDCVELKGATKCTKQEITVADNKNVPSGKFDSGQIPKNADGTYKVNLANITVINEDLGGGNGMRYFMLRFVPQDDADQVVYPNGQMYPNYYEVIVDSTLKPLKGMRLAPGQAAQVWLDKKSKESAKMVKQKQIEAALEVTNYLTVMADR